MVARLLHRSIVRREGALRSNELSSLSAAGMSSTAAF